MNHNEIKNLLSAYHDGELTGKKKKEVEKHIQSCPECQKELDMFHRLDQWSAQIKEKEKGPA